MILLALLFTLLLQLPVLNCQAVDAYCISPYEKLEAMERLLLTPSSSTIGVFVNPCSTFLGSPNQGEQTSAEWVRIVFHDAITANIAAGTGLVLRVKHFGKHLLMSYKRS